MPDTGEFTVKIANDASVGNPVVKTEVRKRGRKLSFDSREKAAEWAAELSTIGNKQLEIEIAYQSGPGIPDAYLVEKVSNEKRYL
jgi:hypothetical protein